MSLQDGGNPSGAEQKKIASRDSWKTNPLPDARIQLHVSKTYTEQEYSAIAQGLIPHEMEEKWFMFLEGDWLNMHRSWTGNCIYRVRFEPDGTGYKIAEVWANRNKEQNKETDDVHDVEWLLIFIEMLIRNNA